MDSWANDIRLMVEKDKRTHKEICELYKWISADNFERTTVLGTSKLRKRWDNLKTKSLAGSSNIQLLRVPTEGDLEEFAKKHGLQESGRGMHEKDFRFALQAEIKEKQLRG